MQVSAGQTHLNCCNLFKINDITYSTRLRIQFPWMRARPRVARDVVVEQQEHAFEDDGRMDRHITIVTVEARGPRTDKTEIDQRGDRAQRMAGPNALFQLNRIAEEITLGLMHAHHCKSLTEPIGICQTHSIWATRPRNVTPKGF